MSESVWCYAHKRWEAADNYLDYPVSDVFRDDAYERGITPLPSPRYVARIMPPENIQGAPPAETAHEPNIQLADIYESLRRMGREIAAMKRQSPQHPPQDKLPRGGINLGQES